MNIIGAAAAAGAFVLQSLIPAAVPSAASVPQPAVN